MSKKLTRQKVCVLDLDSSCTQEDTHLGGPPPSPTGFDMLAIRVPSLGPYHAK